MLETHSRASMDWKLALGLPSTGLRRQYFLVISYSMLYVLLQDSDTLCDPYGNTCFRMVMNNASLWVTCDCLPECNNVRYSTSVVVKPFNVEAICNQTSQDLDFDAHSEDMLGKVHTTLPITI